MAAPHEQLNRGVAAGAAKASAHLEPLTRAYGRALRAAGRRATARFQQSETVLAAANPEPPAWTVPPTASLINGPELAADTQRKTGKLHRLILASAATEGLAPFGLAFDVRAPTSTAILEAYAARIQATIESAIAEQVTEAIQAGYAAGSSVATTSRAIQAAVDGISRVRADMLARTDLNGLSNAGSLMAATISGAASTKTWLATNDEKTREWHADADGQTVPIDQPFDVDGESLDYPGDPNGSEENVINCRCSIVYGNPLTASGNSIGAQPRDFASWVDFAWEGAVSGPREAIESKESLERTVPQPPGPLTASPTPGTLYLARHGLTAYDSDDHASDTIRGWADDPLTPEGEREAGRLASALESLGLTAVQTSDLQRASRTASIVAKRLEQVPEEMRALRPWNLGDLQGRTSEDAADEIAAYCDQPDVPVPGGESFADFCGRFLPAVADAMAQAQGGATPLLMTHSHNLKLARAWIEGGRAPVGGEAFMAPSPGPASVLACTPDGESWLVSEILCDGAPLPAASVPPEAHYRPSDDPERECDTCNAYQAGHCTMFEGDPPVIADYVCDDFVPRAAAAAITSGGEMSTTLHLQAGNGARVVVDVLAATGATSLPLSERDRAWDAGEATGRVKRWASSDGSGDPDKIDYGKLARGYFWQDKAGDGGPKIGDFKLPFADVVGGKLTAVWRGVTAGAQRLSQTQGIDKGAVQSRMAAYYSKAAKTYSDPSIKPPWKSGSAQADGEQLAAIRAHLADQGADIIEDDELRAIVLAVQAANQLAAHKHRYQGGVCGICGAPEDIGVGAPGMAARHPYAGTGGPCEMCGQPQGAYCHGGLTASLEDVELTAAAEGGTQWQATLCVADEPTVDSGIKRLLVAGGGSWLPLPLPLGLLDDTPHADMTTKSPVVGRIDQIWWAGNVCQASGVFFDASDDQLLAQQASKAAALVGEMRRMGVSVDLVDTEVEMRAWSDGALDVANDPTSRNDEQPDAPGGPATEAGLPSMGDDDPVEQEPYEEPEYVAAFSQWVIAGATICPVQALTQATISLVAGAQPSGYRWFAQTAFAIEAAPLTASAAGLAPTYPPQAWFDVPEPDEPTPLTVADDGRVYGHMALWDSCHTAFQGQCVPPPKSPSDYSGFHLGALRTEEGGQVAVGTLTMDTGHAGKLLSAGAAVDHYDHTGTAAAYVRARDGKHGIWVSGALSPRLAAADAQALMAAKPSGDWREVFRGRGRDLIGALMVNVPGFVVPRALTASGLLGDEDAVVEFWSECAPCEAAAERELQIIAASADGIDGLADLVLT